MKFNAAALLVSIAALSAPLPAAAQSRVGVLECNVSRGVGLVITSTRGLNCVFRGVRRVERYVGTVRRFGLDIGVTGRGRLAWAVFAAARPGPGALEGGYAGGSAAASFGLGFGANALVGGLNNSFALQPLSIEGQTGISLAAGVGAMELYYAAPRRVVR